MAVTTVEARPAQRQVRDARWAELERRKAVRSVLSRVERVIFRGDGQAVARANAWAAVQEDRERARLRAAATAELALGGPAAGRK
jgi:hypothetical protein